MGREWKNETVGVIIICTILGCPKRRESQLILSVHIPASIKKKKKKVPGWALSVQLSVFLREW